MVLSLELLYEVPNENSLFRGKALKREVGRKVRSDKKHDIKPYINLELKDSIYRLSYITKTPVKDVCEQLCLNAVNNEVIMNDLSRYFRRKVFIDSTLYRGHLDNPRIYYKNQSIQTERISLRVTNGLHEFIHSLSYALDCSVARVTAIFLEKGMQDVTFINRYINTYITEIMDENRKKELQKIVDYINGETEEEHSVASLLSFIVDEFKKPLQTTKEAINEFVINWQKN